MKAGAAALVQQLHHRIVTLCDHQSSVVAILYKQGDREPWTHMLEHEQERDILPEADLDDGTLLYR